MYKYVVRKPKHNELPLILSLYKSGFVDECPDVPFKYNVISEETSYVLLHENKIIGMIVFIPCYYKGEKGHQAHALTIDKDYRGKHLGLYLFDEMIKERQLAGDKFSIMLPAYFGLYDYYSNLGYKAITAKSKIVSYGENIKYTGDLVIYSDKYKEYCLESAKLNSGIVQENPCIICSTKSVDSEIMIAYDCYPDVQGNIHYKLDNKSRIYIPDKNGNEVFGMIKNFDNKTRHGIFPWLTNK